MIITLLITTEKLNVKMPRSDYCMIHEIDLQSRHVRLLIKVGLID
jgi:hypothetical protein